MNIVKLAREAKFRSSVILDRFVAETRGVAAVEFALIAPLMILLFFGTLEVSTAVAVNRKVSRISSTIGDLITQSQTLSEDDVTDIMKSASLVMKPYDHTVGIVITGINIASGTAKVEWSRAQNDTPSVVDAIYPVPDTIKIDGTFLVAAKISVSHTPMVAFLSMREKRQLTFDRAAIDMEEEIFLRPRIGSKTTIN